MLSCDLAKIGMSKKTDFSSGTHSKVNIKSINRAKYLLFGTVKDKTPGFAVTIFQEFTFVLWAVIWPTSKI